MHPNLRGGNKGKSQREVHRAHKLISESTGRKDTDILKKKGRQNAVTKAKTRGKKEEPTFLSRCIANENCQGRHGKGFVGGGRGPGNKKFNTAEGHTKRT